MNKHKIPCSETKLLSLLIDKFAASNVPEDDAPSPASISEACGDASLGGSLLPSNCTKATNLVKVSHFVNSSLQGKIITS